MGERERMQTHRPRTQVPLSLERPGSPGAHRPADAVSRPSHQPAGNRLRRREPLREPPHEPTRGPSLNEKALPKKRQRKRLKKRTATAIRVAVAALVLLGAVFWLIATTPGWHTAAGLTYYIPEGTRSPAKGFYTVDGVAYLFSERGLLLRDWCEYDGNTYYVGEDNLRAFGPRVIEGVEYWFDPDTGVFNTGFLQAGEGVFGFDERGFPLTGYSRIDDSLYYFDKESGLMKTGWFEVDGARHATLEDGALLTGWQVISGKTYYFDPDTARMRQGITVIDGKKHLFGEDGALQLGTSRYLEDTYLTDAAGVVLTGWQEQAGKKYYLDPATGKMALGVCAVEGKRYVFDSETGVMAAGTFRTVDDKTYYPGADGVAVVGWQDIGGSTYYFDAEAVMMVGYQTIGGNAHYFAETGALMKGFQELGGVLHYFGEDGIIKAGAYEHGGVSRLFGGDGRVLSGFQTLGGATYYYVDGVKQTGTVQVDGVNYNLGADGILRTGWQGNKYYNQYGYPLTGWQTLDGVLRHFADNGEMSVNTQIGDYAIDGNGAAQKKASAPALTDAKACYTWVREKMRYASITDGGYDANIKYALENGRGACYHYAALLHHTLKNSGISATYITGTNPRGGRHDWVQVGDTVYDATNGYIVSVDEMREKGFSW